MTVQSSLSKSRERYGCTCWISACGVAEHAHQLWQSQRIIGESALQSADCLPETQGRLVCQCPGAVCLSALSHRSFLASRLYSRWQLGGSRLIWHTRTPQLASSEHSERRRPARHIFIVSLSAPRMIVGFVDRRAR